MKVATFRYLNGWKEAPDSELDSENTLVLVFGKIGYNSTVSKAVEDVCELFKKNYLYCLISDCKVRPSRRFRR